MREQAYEQTLGVYGIVAVSRAQSSLTFRCRRGTLPIIQNTVPRLQLSAMITWWIDHLETLLFFYGGFKALGYLEYRIKRALNHTLDGFRCS